MIYIQADETTLKVINDNGSESKSKNICGCIKLVILKHLLFYMTTQKTRSSLCPKNFLKDFSVYLQTDGSSGYNSVCNAK
ncbi:transposase [Clostridium perfringens]|nr:transposase [Clostridium perfringens]